jgi:hypothetical protein
MANKKQFFRDVNPGDVSIEGRQSNGITARADGSVILYSGVKNNELENLQNYNGNIPIDGYLGNIIAVLKADQEVAFPIGNNNEETYIESTQIDPNKIITAENTTTDCGNEFDEAATVLLNWENDNVSLGWDPYGANGTGIKNGEIDKAKKYFLDNYWNTNDKNTGDYSIAEAASTLTSPDEPKLLIKNLPPGLRIMAAQFNYNAKQWWTRILAAVGEDWLNSIYGLPYRVTVNLPKTGGPFVYEYFLKDGVTKSGNKVYSPYAPIPFNAGKDQTVREGWKRVWLFLREYDDIISLYNKDKVKFLTALKDETIRYYKTLDNSNNRQDLLNFHVTYVEKAYELALKYKDCPPQQTQQTQTQQVQQVQQTQQQTTSNTLPTKEDTPPDPAIEFLPETEFAQSSVQIFDDEINYITIGNLSPLSPEKYAEGEKVTVVGNNGYKTSYVKKGKYFYPDPTKIPLLKDKSFTDKVKQIANEFGISAEFLIKIMINESGLNPASGLWRKCLNAKCSGKVLYSNKPEAGYTLFGCGLVGFIAPYAPNVCNGNSVDVVITQSALTQLDYVRNILKNNEKTVRGASDALLYMHFFVPALIKAVKDGNDSTVLKYGRVSAETVSIQNPGFATIIGKNPGDPITIGDFKQGVSIKFNYTLPPF